MGLDAPASMPDAQSRRCVLERSRLLQRRAALRRPSRDEARRSVTEPTQLEDTATRPESTLRARRPPQRASTSMSVALWTAVPSPRWVDDDRAPAFVPTPPWGAALAAPAPRVASGAGRPRSVPRPCAPPGTRRCGDEAATVTRVLASLGRARAATRRGRSVVRGARRTGGGLERGRIARGARRARDRRGRARSAHWSSASTSRLPPGLFVAAHGGSAEALCARALVDGDAGSGGRRPVCENGRGTDTRGRGRSVRRTSARPRGAPGAGPVAFHRAASGAVARRRSGDARLAHLRDARFAVWPFDPTPPARPRASTLWPPLCHARAVSRPNGQPRRLSASLGGTATARPRTRGARPRAPTLASTRSRSDTRSGRRAALAVLPRARDVLDRLEGRIWEPPATAGAPSATGTRQPTTTPRRRRLGAARSRRRWRRRRGRPTRVVAVDWSERASGAERRTGCGEVADGALVRLEAAARARH
jgi:hypothetical protein